MHLIVFDSICLLIKKRHPNEENYFTELLEKENRVKESGNPTEVFLQHRKNIDRDIACHPCLI
jgi:hypothetical protein